MFSLDDLEQATGVVRSVMPPTPQYAWPLLRRRYGVELVVKHENHTPIAFKVRGGLTYLNKAGRQRNARQSRQKPRVERCRPDRGVSGLSAG
jgi:threonine dehydratase